jgi:predicted nucleic acid-binding protein
MHSDSDKKAVLVRLSQFVFTKESEDLRKDLFDSLVEQVLLYHGEMSKIQIKESIEKVISSNVPVVLLEETLERLVEKNRVQIKNTKKISYSLTPCRRDEILRLISHKPDPRKFYDTLINRLKTYGLSYEQSKIASEIFCDFLVRLLSRDAKYAANFLAGKASKTIDFLSSRDLLHSILVSKGVTESISNALLSLVSLPSFWEEVKEFLSFIAQNFVCFEILQLDPEVNLLKKEAFSNKLLLLDTNVIVALLLQPHPYHNITMRVIETAKALGVRIAYTERTIREFLALLDEANELWQDVRSRPSSLLKRIENEIIRTYVLFREKYKSWDGYYYTLKQVKKLLQEHGVFEFTIPPLEGGLLRDNQMFQEVVGYVRQYALEISNNPKASSVAEHDAYHLLLIRDLNKPPDMFGPKILFLTYDYSLPYVDEEINKRLQAKDGPPQFSSIHPRIWLSASMRFLSPNTLDKQFSAYFAELMSSDFVYVHALIPAETLAEVASPWLDYDAFDEKTLVEILSDKSLQELSRKIRAFIRERNEEGARKEREKLAQLVNQKLSQQIRSLLSEVKKQEQELSTMRKIIEENTKWTNLTVAGSLASLLAAIFLNPVIGGTVFLLTLGLWLNNRKPHHRIATGEDSHQ